MGEEEYDALTEEEKISFNREVQQALRERKRRSASRAGRKGSTAPGAVSVRHTARPGDQGHRGRRGGSSGHRRPGRMTC